MIKYVVGDRVHYVSGSHGASRNNPLKGTGYECAGTVIRDKSTIGDYPLEVMWDNGKLNTYKYQDMAYAEGPVGPTNPNVAFCARKRRR